MNYDIQYKMTREDIINDYVKLMNGYIKLRETCRKYASRDIVKAVDNEIVQACLKFIDSIENN